MTLKPYQFKKPADVIEEVARRVPLTAGAVYAVLVDNPSTDQRIVAVRRFDTPALIDDWQDAREEIREVMHGLPIPDEPRLPRHAALTVLVRPGLCVLGPNEGTWMNAWRYSNHLANAYSGDLILVTEHGWYDFMTDTAGHSPSIAV